MALVLKDRVQETATANTTVSFTLLGAVTGYQAFSVVGNTNTTYYSATDSTGAWEVGLGTYSTSGPTLTRTTILSSSNSGSAVTFSGTVNVFLTYPSSRVGYINGDGTTLQPGLRIDPRVVPPTNSVSPLTPDVSAADIYVYTALSTALTINAPVGTPLNGDKLIFRILDNGTARALNWNATYTVIGVTLPTTTTVSKTTYVGCIYNAYGTNGTDPRWDVIAVTTQA
jgi:hypothetical protein